MSWNVDTAINAVATTPVHPRRRIHHANNASAHDDSTTDGTRNAKSLTSARANGIRIT